MAANPVLAEATRNGAVENVHRGAWCVVDDAGNLVAGAGNPEIPVFPRSAVKPMQAMALLRSGAAERLQLGAEEIALACASHYGEGQHIQWVSRILDKSGSSVDDLACGAHPPIDPAARKALYARGERPSAIHNNCSGKHAGMLADARALGVSGAGYTERDHPVQRAVREGIEAVIGERLDETRRGIDGCSLPAWSMSLRALARGFARMATGKDLTESDAYAARRIFDAATAHPFLVAGTGAFNTVAMKAFGGRLMLKSGADGVQAGAVRDLGLGFALKIDDGHGGAAEVAAAALIDRIAEPDERARRALTTAMAKPRLNVRGNRVGAVRATR